MKKLRAIGARAGITALALLFGVLSLAPFVSAAPNGLRLNPVANTYPIGYIFNMQVIIDGNEGSRIRSNIKFDPTMLRVITTSSAGSSYQDVDTTFSNPNGTISIQASNGPKTGYRLVTTIKMRALKAGTTQVKFTGQNQYWGTVLGVLAWDDLPTSNASYTIKTNPPVKPKPKPPVSPKPPVKPQPKPPIKPTPNKPKQEQKVAKKQPTKKVTKQSLTLSDLSIKGITRNQASLVMEVDKNAAITIGYKAYGEKEHIIKTAGKKDTKKTVTLKQLSPDTTYTVRVNARAKDGTSFSDALQFTTQSKNGLVPGVVAGPASNDTTPATPVVSDDSRVASTTLTTAVILAGLAVLAAIVALLYRHRHVSRSLIRLVASVVISRQPAAIIPASIKKTKRVATTVKDKIKEAGRAQPPHSRPATH